MGVDIGVEEGVVEYICASFSSCVIRAALALAVALSASSISLRDSMCMVDSNLLDDIALKEAALSHHCLLAHLFGSKTGLR